MGQTCRLITIHKKTLNSGPLIEKNNPMSVVAQFKLLAVGMPQYLVRMHAIQSNPLKVTTTTCAVRW